MMSIGSSSYLEGSISVILKRLITALRSRPQLFVPISRRSLNNSVGVSHFWVSSSFLSSHVHLYVTNDERCDHYGMQERTCTGICTGEKNQSQNM